MKLVGGQGSQDNEGGEGDKNFDSEQTLVPTADANFLMEPIQTEVSEFVFHFYPQLAYQLKAVFWKHILKLTFGDFPSFDFKLICCYLKVF